VSPTFALIPSPFLGPAVWEPVAARLAERGRSAMVPAAPARPIGSPADVIDWLDAALPEAGELFVVPHSNAGLYVPAIVAMREVRGFVFVDAILPPRAGRRPVAPAGLVAELRGLAGPDGLLPPWTRWWPEETTAALFPDPATRRRVEAEQPKLPLAYLTGRVDIVAGWDAAAPGAYVAFGDTYAEEVADAGARGWPTAILDGGHLHMLRDPAGVARTLIDLAA
jgi:hypothetical protein